MVKSLLSCSRGLVFVLLVSRPALAEQAPSKKGSARKPNIVLIVADDLGYGELGCYGQKKIKTPSLDRLATEGMRFTQFYSGSPVCAPARCMLMTGKHSGHAFIRSNGDPTGMDDLRAQYGWEFPGQYPLPAEEITLAERMKSLGYVTGAAGKWGLGHFGTSGDPNQQGFDLFYGYNCQRQAHNHYPRFLWRNGVKEPLAGNDRTLHGETYSQDKFTEVALQFLDDNQDRPFFLFLPFVIPHVGIQVPEASLAEYRGKFPEEAYEHTKHNYVEHPTPRAGYAAMITHMDRDIGTILERLRKLGLEENTIVLFTSDNGPTYDRVGGADSTYFESAGPLRGRKASVYEGGVRVPLIARWPERFAAGSTSDLQAAFWDLLPTFCDFAGGTAPTEIDGISFAPTLLGEGSQEQHEYLYWEFPSYGGQQAIRVGDWKAVRQNILEGETHVELYDLSKDIGEQNDLSAEQPERVAKLQKMMAAARTPSTLFPLFESDSASRTRN